MRKRISSIIVACATFIFFMTSINTVAASTTDDMTNNETSASLNGDVNSDGTFDVADVVLLQKWLLAVPDTNLVNWKAGNYCDDERLDVFDLCLMKRALLKKQDSESNSFRTYCYRISLRKSFVYQIAHLCFTLRRLHCSYSCYINRIK